MLDINIHQNHSIVAPLCIYSFLLLEGELSLKSFSAFIYLHPPSQQLWTVYLFLLKTSMPTASSYHPCVSQWEWCDHGNVQSHDWHTKQSMGLNVWFVLGVEKNTYDVSWKLVAHQKTSESFFYLFITNKLKYQRIFLYLMTSNTKGTWSLMGFYYTGDVCHCFSQIQTIKSVSK